MLYHVCSGPRKQQTNKQTNKRKKGRKKENKKERKRMGGWMDEWMDGWMGGWMDGWMDGWINKQTDKTKEQYGRSGKIKSECLTCTFRTSCCSARLSRAQVPVFTGSSVQDSIEGGGGGEKRGAPALAGTREYHGRCLDNYL